MEHPLINHYRKVIKRLLQHMRSYDKQPNQAIRMRILDTFEVISSFKTSIRLNVDEIDPLLGYRLKRRLITLFDQCISAFTYKRDFNKEIEAVRKSLEETITFEEVQLLSNQDSAPQQLDSNNDGHPPHDPNLWDKTTYDLFKYLYDNYYSQGRKTKRKLTNIWFFLKEYDNSIYVLIATKDIYKNFIKKEYKIDIKNFDKVVEKYILEDYNSMNEHRINFE